MAYTVVFYEPEDGDKPVEEFLDSLNNQFSLQPCNVLESNLQSLAKLNSVNPIVFPSFFIRIFRSIFSLFINFTTTGIKEDELIEIRKNIKENNGNQ